MLVTEINGRAYCLQVHVRDALDAGETAQRIAVLPAWRDTTLFTDVECAALTLAESRTTLPGPGPGPASDGGTAAPSRKVTS